MRHANRSTSGLINWIYYDKVRQCHQHGPTLIESTKRVNVVDGTQKHGSVKLRNLSNGSGTRR